MTPRHFYWLYYGISSPGGSGEDSVEMMTPVPITTGDQVLGLGRTLAGAYGNGVDITVRHWQFLREEPDE